MSYLEHIAVTRTQQQRQPVVKLQ